MASFLLAAVIMTNVNCLGKAQMLPNWRDPYLWLKLFFFFLTFQLTLFLGDDLELVIRNMQKGIWSWKCQQWFQESLYLSGGSEVVQILVGRKDHELTLHLRYFPLRALFLIYLYMLKNLKIILNSFLVIYLMYSINC